MRRQRRLSEGIRKTIRPTPVTPTLQTLRPETPQNPAVETGEELANVSLAEVKAPAANDRIDLGDDLLGAHRGLAPSATAYLFLEVLDRFRAWIRIEVTLTGTATNPRARQRKTPSATLDFVSEKLKTV